MINLDPASLHLLKQLLQQTIPNYPVWLFGSRATPHCKTYSDIDLAIISKHAVPPMTLALLDTVLTESDLPYKVDVIDWATVDADFQRLIGERYTILQTGEPQ